MRRCTGLRPSRTSGNVREMITDIAYERYDVCISSSTATGTILCAAIDVVYVLTNRRIATHVILALRQRRRSRRTALRQFPRSGSSRYREAESLRAAHARPREGAACEAPPSLPRPPLRPRRAPVRPILAPSPWPAQRPWRCHSSPRRKLGRTVTRRDSKRLKDPNRTPQLKRVGDGVG